MLLILAIVCMVALVTSQSHPRPVIAFIQVDNGGRWGTWQHDDFCPHGTYAYGFRVKVEEYQYGNDDTGINAMQLVCAFPEDRRKFGGTMESGYGEWGQWTGWHYCKETQFLSSFSLKVEPDQGFAVDDTAVNGIRFGCRPIKAASTFNTHQFIEEKEVGQFGDYGQVAYCPTESAICGMQTRVEENQYGGDDTALNDVKFYCCRPADDPEAILVG